MNKLIESLETVYKLKQLQRTGWIMNKIENAETVAAHTFGCSFLALLFAKQLSLDENKCIKLCIVHDLQESIVGDFTPNCKITEFEKHNKEKVANVELAQKFGNDEIKELFDEFEAKETKEALFVHDCDKLDMLLQAFIYEKQFQIDLGAFFASCELPESFEFLKSLRNEIETLRK